MRFAKSVAYALQDRIHFHLIDRWNDRRLAIDATGMHPPAELSLQGENAEFASRSMFALAFRQNFGAVSRSTQIITGKGPAQHAPGGTDHAVGLLKPDPSAIYVELDSSFFERGLECPQCRAPGQPGHRAPGADLVNRDHVARHCIIINCQVYLTIDYEPISIIIAKISQSEQK